MDEQKQSNGLNEYRNWLIRARHQTIAAYDRAVFVLAGGALGLSLTFVREIAPIPRPCSIPWLGASWFLFVLSLISTFCSLLTSQHAFLVAIRQVDEGVIYTSEPGGRLQTATTMLNVSSAVFFVAGVICLVIFALVNISA
jgi:hypothetical protein